MGMQREEQLKKRHKNNTTTLPHTEPRKQGTTSSSSSDRQVVRELERTQSVFIRHGDEVSAMAWNERLRTRIKTFFTGTGKETAAATANGDANISSSALFSGGGGSGALGGAGSGSSHALGGAGGGGDDEEAAAAANAAPVQYRLEATVSRGPKMTWSRRLWTCSWFGADHHHHRRSSRVGMSGINPNQKLAMWLHWMFRVNFVFLFSVMCIMFFTLVIFFSGFITLAGVIDPECVRVGGNPFNEQNTAFADAFALSWTTFSTVGYGSTYPALGYQNDSPTNCFFINFICSLEALIGVLYSGFCGAILFGKVLRIQSHAQVTFSDPIVIRYGPGLKESSGDRGGRDASNGDGGVENGHGTEAVAEKMPCPVLEFRIVNRLYGEAGGEIMDASLNVVANVDANDTDPTNRDTSTRSQSKRPSDTDGVSYTSGNHTTSVHSETTSQAESLRTDTSGGDTLRSLQRFLNPLNKMGVTHQTVDEDPSSRLLSKHIFSKMMIEASDHPFFKRVWLARHVLDETSPILKPSVRKEIQKNGGFWPAKRANHAAIRRSLKFNQILVSLNGVSNVSASDVYAQKIYDFVDINIGYQFVNILYRDPTDGSLGVDIDLINDVREQNGGGGEPLIIDD